MDSERWYTSAAVAPEVLRTDCLRSNSLSTSDYASQLLAVDWAVDKSVD